MVEQGPIDTKEEWTKVHHEPLVPAQREVLIARTMEAIIGLQASKVCRNTDAAGAVHAMFCIVLELLRFSVYVMIDTAFTFLADSAHVSIW